MQWWLSQNSHCQKVEFLVRKAGPNPPSPFHLNWEWGCWGKRHMFEIPLTGLSPPPHSIGLLDLKRKSIIFKYLWWLTRSQFYFDHQVWRQDRQHHNNHSHLSKRNWSRWKLKNMDSRDRGENWMEITIFYMQMRINFFFSCFKTEK